MDLSLAVLSIILCTLSWHGSVRMFVDVCD